MYYTLNYNLIRYFEAASNFNTQGMYHMAEMILEEKAPEDEILSISLLQFILSPLQMISSINVETFETLNKGKGDGSSNIGNDQNMHLNEASHDSAMGSGLFSKSMSELDASDNVSVENQNFLSDEQDWKNDPLSYDKYHSPVPVTSHTQSRTSEQRGKPRSIEEEKEVRARLLAAKAAILNDSLAQALLGNSIK